MSSALRGFGAGASLAAAAGTGDSKSAQSAKDVDAGEIEIEESDRLYCVREDCKAKAGAEVYRCDVCETTLCESCAASDGKHGFCTNCDDKADDEVKTKGDEGLRWRTLMCWPGGTCDHFTDESKFRECRDCLDGGAGDTTPFECAECQLLNCYRCAVCICACDGDEKFGCRECRCSKCRPGKHGPGCNCGLSDDEGGGDEGDPDD